MLSTMSHDYIFLYIQVHIMKKIRAEYTPNPEFDPVKVRTASSAAEGLCRWVQAMEIYDRVAKVSSPHTHTHTHTQYHHNIH